MLLSIQWLRDYLLKSDVKFKVEDLAEKLTMRGLPVASVKKVGNTLANVVVGKIVKIDKHPNADRLQVTQVLLSENADAETQQIVCGAKNIAEGDYVPVALPGCVLPGNFEIKVSTIRGVESRGMICSGRELGISEDSEGILQLPKHGALGIPISRLLGGGQEDTVMEFELTPNRGDCLGVMGLAREIAPLLNTKMREPKPARFRSTEHRTSSIIKVEVDDAVLCPRYVARVVDNLKVAESPDWIKHRLEAVGMRPINNIVDITNFVMLEYGQPLHAFNLRRIESSTIRVAPCKYPMPFTLISGETVQLEPGDILIFDGEKPVALAGIMGGANSQIEPDTTSIILESAAFLPSQIRKTAKRLGLSTDSSKRFEKGYDLNSVMLASERAASLLRDSFNGNVYHPPIDTNEAPVKEPTISVDMRDVRKVLGVPDFSSETATELLDAISIVAHKKSTNIISVKLPSHRPDLLEGIDVIEEVARLYGYEHIPSASPVSLAAYDKLDEAAFEFENRAREVLYQMGLRETMHYSFTSEDILRKFGMLGTNLVNLKNPISEEMKVMRPSLLPSLLQTYSYNRNRKVSDQRLFEVARSYTADPQEETGVRETLKAAGILSGNLFPATWTGEKKEANFYNAKFIVETLARQLTTVFLAFEPMTNSSLFHPARSATVKLGLAEIGSIGEVHPFVRDVVLETTEPVILFELNLEALRKYERTQLKFKTPGKFPSSDIDIAVVVDKTVQGGALVENIRHSGGELLHDVSLFDLYEGENIPSGKKSLAFRLIFQSDERTLQDEEVMQLREKIVRQLSDKFGASLRG